MRTVTTPRRGGVGGGASVGDGGPRGAGSGGATAVLLAGLALVLAACGGEPAPPPGPDPATRAYCDTVLRVQAEQSAPGAGEGGVDAASEATRRQIAELVRTAPPEIAGDWRAVAQLTERSLASLAETGGDPRLIDRGELERLRRESAPAVARVSEVTGQRCGITFTAPG